uniref:MULTIHEME_CYTC domain-containing protein n=1 Tax=Caenorhabditis tropicalis TaxID=1561998 RepID=A0A1I7TW87_9PELO
MNDPFNVYYTVPPNLPMGKTSCDKCMVEYNIGESCRNCNPVNTTVRTAPKRKARTVKKCNACKSNITTRQRIYPGDICVICHTNGIMPSDMGDNKTNRFKSSHQCTKCSVMFRDYAFSDITLCPTCYKTEKGVYPAEAEPTPPKVPSRKRPSERAKAAKPEPMVVIPVESTMTPQSIPLPEYMPSTVFEYPPIPAYNGMMTGNDMYAQMFPYPDPSMPLTNGFYPSYQEYHQDYNYYNPQYNYNVNYATGYGYNYQQ